jgi:hypothetical protein
MKTNQKIAAGALAVSALAAPAFAQNSVTGVGTGNVTIVSPLTITPTAPMSFGRLVKPASAGTVVLTAANSATYTGGAQSVGTPTTTVAAFNVVGDGASNFSIGSDASFSMTGAGTAIVVTPLLSATSGTLTGTAGTSTTSSFTVGGTMSLGASQAAGAYTGTFHVMVAYN